MLLLQGFQVCDKVVELVSFPPLLLRLLSLLPQNLKL